MRGDADRNSAAACCGPRASGLISVSSRAAISPFSRRTDCLTDLANYYKVIDGDTIVLAGELVRLHGIDAPELDQTFWLRGQQIACGTMSLAALEALIAGVKVRCEVVERDRRGRQGLLAQWRRRNAGWYRQGWRYSKDYVAAENEAKRKWAGHLRQALGVAGIIIASTPSARAGTRRQPAGSWAERRACTTRAGRAHAEDKVQVGFSEGVHLHPVAVDQEPA